MCLHIKGLAGEWFFCFMLFSFFGQVYVAKSCFVKFETGYRHVFFPFFFLTAGDADMLSKDIRVSSLHWFLVCTCSCPVFIQ